MKTEMMNFAFDEHLVRVIERNGDPWFVAADVCACLDIKNTSQATQPLDEDEIGICKTYTNKGERETLVVSVSGLATLMVRSRLATTSGTKPHRFRRWLFGEVLPQIQKTGSYTTPTKPHWHDEAPISTDILATDRRQALAEVREARLIYGTTAARQLWEASPHLPQIGNAGRRDELSGSPAEEVRRALLEIILDDDMRSVKEAVEAGDTDALEAVGLRLVAGGAWLLPRHPRLWPRWQATRWRDGHQGRPIWLPSSLLT